MTNAEKVAKISENKSYLRLELKYRKKMHPKDADQNPELYKVNGVSAEEMKENLTSLVELTSSSADSAPAVFFTEDEVMEILGEIDTSTSETRNKKFEFHQPVAAVSDEARGKQWHIGFVTSESSDVLIVDYLERKGTECDDAWQRPAIDDV